MEDFIHFYAPFVVLIASIIFSFWFAMKDHFFHK
ncbi:cytochrome bd oxidase small subunit CydS [Gracilibacillus halophilus]